MTTSHQAERKASCIRTLRKSSHLWPVINVLAIVTWIFSLAGTFHCSFMMVEMKPTVNETGSDENADHPVGLGLFSTSVYDMDANLLGCVSYYGTSDEFDGAFRAARIFGLMTAIATSVALICVLLVTLFVEKRSHKVNLWSVARFLFFAAFLCQLLTFLAFGRELCSRSDMECHTGPASIVTILDLFLLCIQSALIYAVPPVKTPVFMLRKEGSPAGDDDQEEIGLGFEVLSKAASKLSKNRRNYDDLSCEIESECGTQTPSIIMEGIECVAADQSKREKKSFLEELVDHYYGIGRKTSTRITIAVMIGLSWIFTVVSTTRCTFILVGAEGQERTDFSGLGLFSRAYYMNGDILGCIAYPQAAKNEFDVPFEAGRAFGMVTLLLVTASFVTFFLLHGFLDSSHNKSAAWWTLVQLTLPCACISQLITFSAFKTQSCANDNVECVPGMGAIFAILNVLVLVPLTFFIFALPCPQRSIFRTEAVFPFPRQSKNKPRKSKSKRQKKSQPEDRPVEEGRLPEPTSTHSVSEQSDILDFGARTKRNVPDPPQGNDYEDMKVYDVILEEEIGTARATKVLAHTKGINTNERRRHNASTGDSDSQTSNNRMEPTSTSGVPTSTYGGPTITQTSSWDSRASLEQFETVDMDNSNGSNRTEGSNYGNKNAIERKLSATASKTKAKGRAPVPSSAGVQKGVRDPSCCIEATAMSIMKEMQEQEEERLRQQQSKKQQKPLKKNSRGSANLPKRNLLDSVVTDTETSRGGPVRSSSATKSDDAVGVASSSGTSFSYSKISSTEYNFGDTVSTSDDGITFNTGDAVNYDQTVVGEKKMKRNVKVFV